MGQAVAKAWDRITGHNRPLRVLIFGLDAAGKTTLLYRLKLGEVVTAIPTIGFNVETVKLAGHPVTIWDVGLRSKMRPLLRHYLTDPLDALIFVVDANDRERTEDARELLHWGLQAAEEKLTGKLPFVLVFVNKADLPNAQSLAEVHEALDLGRLAPAFQSACQLCSACTGDGLREGFQTMLAAVHGKHSPLAEPQASQGVMPSEPPQEEGQRPREVPGGDDAFLEMFEAGDLPVFGVKEALRLAYLHRQRIPGASARISFEAAKQLGYVAHATRTWFWISLAFRLPEQTAESSLAWVSTHRGLDLRRPEAQEALVLRSYTRETLDGALAALTPLPPDYHVATEEEEADEAFLRRVEAAELQQGEMDPFSDLVRLAFVLLRRLPRRQAIKRMDAALRRLEAGWSPPGCPDVRCSRPFHETRQYVALQLAHAAMASEGELRDFAALAAARPELCAERLILQHYSAQVLASGKEQLVVPDLRALPTVVALPWLSWHEELSDDEFLNRITAQALPSVGLPSLMRCAYLLLRDGRRGGSQKLLDTVAAARKGQAAGSLAHETLAHLAMHMVHFYASAAGWSLSEPFAAFASGCGRKVLDPRLPYEFYTKAALDSKEAQEGLLLPDVCPLPNLLPSSARPV